MIDNGYAQANGSPFRISTPSNDHLIITSKQLIKELIDAPPGDLSLHAVAKEMLQPKHTMNGFEWQDQRGVEGTGFVRAIRSRLTSHLPKIDRQLAMVIRESLEEELRDCEAEGTARKRLFPMIKRIVTRVNCFVFFGEELSRDEEFTTAALEFPEVVVLTAEVMRITPNFLRPLVASFVTRQHRAAKTMSRYLEPIVSQRLALREQSFNKNEAVASDCMQWLIDTSPRKNPWTPARMVSEIMAIWFSAVHQLAMTATYAIEDICLHSEHMQPVREEIRNQLAIESETPIVVERLPLLDSFLKESIRFTNVDAISCRRKALRDFVFGNGTVVQRGDWVCIPQRAMMHDARGYSDPENFDVFRFSRANALLGQSHRVKEVPDESPGNLTTSNIYWPIWGLGNTACLDDPQSWEILRLIGAQTTRVADFVRLAMLDARYNIP
ncbi:hypothetical protein HIM_05143 [Hirsutella minnesotensis 3608]|uniref:Cytochrome P450 n=1 Tax=Hirsutella minnesotensis 3608 TaxID=1043627 RepID=A0A0F8A0L5_9HYPO|nr:hypothetical protein HIM_05143 [Hirsutella minnesotensis 3608]